MNEPIRVLHVVTHMNRGGLETMLMNYYREFDRSKVQFDFLTHRNDVKDYDVEILSLGGRIYHLPTLNPFSRKYRQSLNQFFVEHNKYNIVHSHLDCMSYYPLMAAKKNGTKILISHSHNADQDKNYKYIVKHFSKKKILTVATHFFSCGIEAGKFLYSGADFSVINNAIDASKFRFDYQMRNEMRRKLKVTDETIIGHVGRFNSQKNHKFLVEIFNRYLKNEPKSILVLIGVGELKIEIEKFVKQLQIEENVKFLGLRDDIPELMQAMDGFLFPSLFEGFPLTLVEAQAAGLPCIVSDNISKEVILTKNVKQISLDADLDEWVMELEHVSNSQNRNDTYENICESGFDIVSSAKYLQEFYLRMETTNDF